MKRPVKMNLVLLASLIVLLAASLSQAGCGANEEDGAAGLGPGAAKADCPDCDPAGPNAFVQAGLGDGFYQAGQSWQVAFRYNHNPRPEMRGDVFLERDTTASEIYLFDYKVTETDKAIVGTTLRQTATVEIGLAPSRTNFIPL